jgi:tetratricopeptide (TPR) repeat protein
MTGASTAHHLTRALALQQQGRMVEAVETLRQLLLREPRNSHALHLLGSVLGQMGRPQQAVELIAAASALQPGNAIVCVNLAHALRDSGRHAEALAAYERAIALQGDLAVAHRGRGVLLLSLGEIEQALASLSRALRLAPHDAAAHNDLGVGLERLGRAEEALEQFARAVALEPRHVEAHHNRARLEMSLGRNAQALASLERALALQPQRAALHAARGQVLRALGRPGDALASYQRALGLVPDDFGALFQHGVTLMMLERHEEALSSFERALAVDGQAAEVHNNRGVALAQLGRHTEALASFSAALTCRAGHVEAHTNSANTLKGLGRFDEARLHLEHALALEPAHVPSLWSKALLELSAGAFAPGWRLYEARLQLPELRDYQRALPSARWDGRAALGGRTILIHAEQGLGDVLQFSRYIPLLEGRAGHVYFEIPAALRLLMRSLPMRGTLLSRGENLPQTDFHCPLLSLPLAFGTELDTIPGGVPYLSVPPAAVEACRDRLSTLPGLKVGLNWQGHPGTEGQPWIRGRSFALESMAPLAQVRGVSLVSVQKGAAAAQREQVAFGTALARFTDPLDTGPEAMMETAALLAALDLVITSDTFVAHLAGALGVPVWIALQAIPDWRWMLERSDSPWYPTARLFRQRVAGDWGELFERIASALAARVRPDAARRARPPRA